MRFYPFAETISAEGLFVQKIYRNILEIRGKRNIIEMFKIELFEREESVC